MSFCNPWHNPTGLNLINNNNNKALRCQNEHTEEADLQQLQHKQSN